MPITELAILEALPPHTADSAPIQTFLSDVALQQAAWSGHPLLFFTLAHDDARTTVVLVSGWADVPAHDAWIASEPNQALLRRAGALLTVRELLHLDIAFETLPHSVQRMTWEVLSRAQADSVDAERGQLGAAEPGSGVWEGAGRVLGGGDGDIHRLRGYVRVGPQEEREITQRLAKGDGPRAQELRRLAVRDGDSP
ncbi:hypothetical protein PsYK624_031120 [Phanerochaete sordida]|uniref:ABM domain-containing protein n=1 Tax=Phanerochaete sordida TaxID=48140 RepID=A0A9P3G366_9APHY|nr:hypothetical protein PsYK624_031120 [Phanerochaete sordida]